jgi:hypothetical protein
MNSSLVRHIQKYPGVEWDYSSLSTHPSVNLSVLKTLRDKPWNWSLLSINQNWSWDWVREFPEEPWNWRVISESAHFNWNWVREFPDKPWRWNILSEKIEGVSTLKEFPDKTWNWYSVTLGPNTSVIDMLDNPNFPWTISELLFTEVDEDIIKFLRFYRSHYDFDAWCDHTTHTNWNLIRENLDLPWVFRCVRFKEIQTDFDGKYFTERYNWDWDHMSEMLDFENVISKHLYEKPWNFNSLSKNRSVTYRHIREYQEVPWNYNLIKLDEEKRDWIAANKIKRQLKKSVTDPSYALCKRIVLDDLFGALSFNNKVSDDNTDN